MGDRRSHGAENGVLFAALGVEHSLAQSADLRHLDWEYILAAAGKQGVAPLLARWVGQGRDGVPRDVTGRLTSANWASHFRSRAQLDQLRLVLAATAAMGIAVMPLKGAALATRYYPAPALRPMSDLDLLVHPADLPRMAAVLRGLGYTAVPRPPSLLDGGDPAAAEYAYVATVKDMFVLIEYRAEPLDPAIGALHAADSAMAGRLRAHSGRMWERALPGTLDAIPCALIGAEDLLLHVASHLTTRHAGLRLLWLHDLRLIAARDGGSLDWDYIVATAHALHLEQPVHAALAAAARWLAAPIPEGQLQRLRANDRVRRSVPRAIEGGALMARVEGLGDAHLTAESQLQWHSLAISAGRLPTMRILVRALRSGIAPSRPYVAWWSGTSVDSRGEYCRMLAFRIAYIFLTSLHAAMARPPLRGCARLTARLIGRMKPLTPYRGD